MNVEQVFFFHPFPILKFLTFYFYQTLTNIFKFWGDPYFHKVNVPFGLNAKHEIALKAALKTSAPNYHVQLIEFGS